VIRVDESHFAGMQNPFSRSARDRCPQPHRDTFFLRRRVERQKAGVAGLLDVPGMTPETSRPKSFAQCCEARDAEGAVRARYDSGRRRIDENRADFMLNTLRGFIERRYPRFLHATRLLRGLSYLPVKEGWHAVWLEYPMHCAPRWGHGKEAHPQLSRIIGSGRQRYAETLRLFLPLADEFAAIPRNATAANPARPHWVNGWLPDLDGIAIYSWLALEDRKQYVEIGSGNSTKFARHAIKAHNRHTRIVSIDPEPRAEVDALCDEVIREKLETVDLSLFDRIGPGDVLFVDSSHYAFMGGDVTVFFFDILPNLKSGVIVGIHDITLPYDYQPDWEGKFYNEQYLLGCWLLGGAARIETILPAWFAAYDSELSALLSPIYATGGLAGMSPHGAAFWFKVVVKSQD
jgi:hypothetical protein